MKRLRRPRVTDLPDWVDIVDLDEACSECGGPCRVHVEVEHFITRWGVRSIERGPYAHCEHGPP